MSTTLADNQCSKMIKEGQKYARCLNAREAGKLACPTHIVSSVAPVCTSADALRITANTLREIGIKELMDLAEGPYCDFYEPFFTWNIQRDRKKLPAIMARALIKYELGWTLLDEDDNSQAPSLQLIKSLQSPISGESLSGLINSTLDNFFGHDVYLNELVPDDDPTNTFDMLVVRILAEIVKQEAPYGDTTDLERAVEELIKSRTRDQKCAHLWIEQQRNKNPCGNKPIIGPLCAL